MLTTVFFDTEADPGDKLDPAMQAEIDYLAPTTVDAGDIEESHLATNSVSTPKIKAGAVTHPKLAADAVETVNVKDAQITEPKLATNSVSVRTADIGIVTAHDAAGNAIELDIVILTTAQYDTLDSGDDLDPNAFYAITA